MPKISHDPLAKVAADIVMETESPKKEKRKRKSDGDSEEPRKKKHKGDAGQTVVAQPSLNGVKETDGFQKSEKRKEKNKHKDRKSEESKAAQDSLPIDLDRTDKRKEKKLKKGREHVPAPSLERHDSPSEKLHKKKRAKEQPATEGAHASDSVDVPESSKGDKRKYKSKKTPFDSAADTPAKGIISPNAVESTKRKEKKQNEREEPETSEDVVDETQESFEIPADEGIEEVGQEKSYFVPANYVDPPSGPKAFEIITASLRVPIPPVGQSRPLASVCADSLSPMILRWDPVFKGIVIAYRNPKLTSDPVQNAGGDGVPFAYTVDEYAAPFIWAGADFVIFKPRRGVWLDGYVNLQNESFLGFVLWNAFTGTIERKRLPKDWIWIEDEEQEAQQEAEGVGDLVEFEMGGRRRKFTHSIGHFEDGDGNPVREEMMVRFRVWDFEPAFSEKDERHFLTLEGSMLTDEEENALQEEERKAQQRARSPRVPITPRRSALRNSSQ